MYMHDALLLQVWLVHLIYWGDIIINQWAFYIAHDTFANIYNDDSNYGNYGKLEHISFILIYPINTELIQKEFAKVKYIYSYNDSAVHLQ